MYGVIKSFGGGETERLWKEERASNWYVALGTTAGMDWYDLTSVSLPYGTSGTYFTSSTTSGDAISIWGFNGGQPQVGLTTGYTSGTPISADMTIAG